MGNRRQKKTPAIDRRTFKLTIIRKRLLCVRPAFDVLVSIVSQFVERCFNVQTLRG
jgi:hypothetical protein